MRLSPDEQEIVDLCRDQTLREHFAALHGPALTCRAPDLSEALAQLPKFGEYELTCRDLGHDARLVMQHVCRVHIRSMPQERGLVEVTGLTPVAAALRCLRAALHVVQREAQHGLAAFDDLLG
jgi:hypothetical protein